jgi:hypothetical protein
LTSNAECIEGEERDQTEILETEKWNRNSWRNRRTNGLTGSNATRQNLNQKARAEEQAEKWRQEDFNAEDQRGTQRNTEPLTPNAQYIEGEEGDQTEILETEKWNRNSWGVFFRVIQTRLDATTDRGLSCLPWQARPVRTLSANLES